MLPCHSQSFTPVILTSCNNSKHQWYLSVRFITEVRHNYVTLRRHHAIQSVESLVGKHANLACVASNANRWRTIELKLELHALPKHYIAKETLGGHTACILTISGRRWSRLCARTFFSKFACFRSAVTATDARKASIYRSRSFRRHALRRIGSIDYSWDCSWLKSVLQVIEEHDRLKMFWTYFAVLVQVFRRLRCQIFATNVNCPSLCSKCTRILTKHCKIRCAC